MTGDVRSVQYFDPGQDSLSISINDVPSKWMYAQIAPLKSDPSQLSYTQRKTLTLLAQ